jgi:hypothetical protein
MLRPGPAAGQHASDDLLVRVHLCRDCAEGVLAGRCPNCGGAFAPRPIRPAALLAKFPPSTERVLKAGGCTAADAA